MTKTIDKYNKVFWQAARAEGSYYTFTESHESMILIEPANSTVFFMRNYY